MDPTKQSKAPGKGPKKNQKGMKKVQNSTEILCCGFLVMTNHRKQNEDCERNLKLHKPTQLPQPTYQIVLIIQRNATSCTNSDSRPMKLMMSPTYAVHQPLWRGNFNLAIAGALQTYHPS